ncbi:MAG: 1-acyl-sn-glycerol-3-phosphate acyltransferase [Verrucomicrobiaceae bacterium]|nr:1-acyl-sn-glycerol-3-phosphate acyltransferase [Verrucomicrobiaceae bacterium]
MAAILNGIRIWAAALACAIYWGVGGGLFLLVGMVLGPILPEKVGRRVGGGLIQGAFAGFVMLLRVFGIAHCRMIGFEKLKEVNGAFILAPNHPAIWDAVFILAKQGGLTCILKASLLKNPLTMGGARLARFIPNEPAVEMVKKCVKSLEEGRALLLFPEGTRTWRREGVVNEFRGGVAILARQTRLPVYPVFVSTTTFFGAKGTPAWRPDPARSDITMLLGDPLVCGEQESSHDFLERLRAEYIRALSRPS